MTSNQPRSGMSLRSQLYGLVIAITVVAFLGSLWASISTIRQYLNDQMATHAQDAATSLGLAIAPYVDEENIVIAETMIHAIFESGYYEAVVLTDLDNKVLVSQHNEMKIEGVPAWFIKLFSLSPPVMTTEINDGWRIAGKLSLKSHAGTSYLTLWQHAIRNLSSILVVCMFALLGAYFILRSVLDPLDKVEHQALAVCKKDFPLIKEIPSTRELQAVVRAMNAMVTNVHKTFDQMSKHAERLNKDVYVDALTNLGNRRAFDSQFKADCAEMSSDDTATFGLVQLPSLQVINNNLGYQAGDEYVQFATEIISRQFKEFGSAKIYRVAGGSFFFTIKDTCSDVKTMCEGLHAKFCALHSAGYPEGFGEIIATAFNKHDCSSELLARLDTLLTQQTSSLKEGDVYNDTSFADSHGLHEWSGLIDQIVAENDVKFMFQPVRDSHSDNILYYELFTQFFSQHQSVANNQLYAMAERLNKSEQLDKLVLVALSKMNCFAPGVKVAVNLTHQSLHDDNFRNWLAHFCLDYSDRLPKIVFEVNEDAVLASVESSMQFIQMTKRFDFEICIERFGSSFTSFKYLKGLDIDYLKIDGAYIRDLDSNPENNHFIQAVTQIGHGVGIKVLCSHVENETSLKMLVELNCDGVQGNYIQPAQHLIEKERQKACIYSPIQLA